MFRSQTGNLGVVFTAAGSTRRVLSLWRSREDVEKLESSPTYRATVSALLATGLLTGVTETVVLESEGGWLAPALLESLGE